MFRHFLVAGVLTSTATLLLAQTEGVSDPHSRWDATLPATGSKAPQLESGADVRQRESERDSLSRTRQQGVLPSGASAASPTGQALFPPLGVSNGGNLANGGRNDTAAATLPGSAMDRSAEVITTPRGLVSPIPTPPANSWGSTSASPSSTSEAAQPLPDDGRTAATPLVTRPWEATRPNAQRLNGAPRTGAHDNGQSWKTQQRGDLTYSTDSNGNTWTSQTRGNQTIINGSDGRTRVCSTYGTQTSCQ